MLKGLAVVGGLATTAFLGVTVNKKMSSLPERYPFIQLGLDVVNAKNIAKQTPMTVDGLSWFKNVHVDDENGVAYAMVKSGIKVIRICARKVRSAPATSALQAKVDPDAHYDETSGIGFYWDNPWELKTGFIRGLKSGGVEIRKLKYRILAILTSRPLDLDDAPQEDIAWELTAVAVNRDAVFGDLLSHPDLASEIFSSTEGRKSDFSKQRAQVALAVLTASAILLILKRGYSNYRIWPSYSFARTFIETHPSVKQFYLDQLEVVSRTGEFGPKKISAEITIAGNVSGGANVESVVKFEASRRGPSDWMVSQASMTPQGCKSIDLLVK